MNPQRLRDSYRSALLDDVLPFWLKHGLDQKNGGYFSALDRDGSLIDTDKSVWIQGRFSWLLSAVNHYAGVDETRRAAAESGLNFIDQFCVDAKDGLMWFQVTADGRPVRKRRYRFSEAFACVAHAAHFRSTGDSGFADAAIQFYRTFNEHRNHPALSPFAPKFTGTRPSKGIGAAMIGINMAQTCRAAGISGIDWANEIDANIAEIESDFVHHDIECVMETVALDGSRIDDHFDGRTLNPGHAIEAAWFILEESKRRGGDNRLTQLGTQMLDWMWTRGWDEEFGGFLYFVGVDHRPVQEYWHDMKFWWPHNEAEIATLLAWQLTGEARYAKMHEKVHDWAWAHFPDAEHGEWFGYLHRDGTVSNTVKGNLWKGPFHIPRMLLTCWQICDELLTNTSADPGLPPQSN
jgi:N-acylglucosamine 2-epimerase